MPDLPAGRAWKIWSAVFTGTIAIVVFWIVEKRSQPPLPPPVTLPYAPPGTPQR